ncbi:MAG: hypothetical protein JKX94_11010, partial [Sneathiella sp.]|nr:hypothetical protein [Sneathiella sp.]
ILDETDNIIEIFQALLRISQIEGGSRKSKFKETDLSEIFCKIAEIFDPVAEDHNHQLTIDIEPNSSFIIKGDVELLTQMIANLVENAITHCSAPSQINLRLYHELNKIHLEVNDNGPGIPDDETKRVMERLYRLEKSRTTPGNGLGLSLIKAVADLHDFEVDLQDNKPGLKAVILIHQNN